MAALVIGAPIMWWQSRQSTGDSFRLAMERTVASKAITNQRFRPFPHKRRRSATRVGQDARRQRLNDSSGREFQQCRERRTKSLDLAKEAEGNSSALKKFAEVAIAPPRSPPARKASAQTRKSRAEIRARLLAEQKGHLASGASKVDQAPAAPKTSEEFAKETSRPVIADSGLLGQKQKAENFRQQFSQTSANEVFRRDVKLQQAANVLNNFQVEQDGRQIRVVDADG